MMGSQIPANNEEIVVSAPGKVILHGEHSVVYGKMALASSLNLRTFLRLKPATGNLLILTLPDIGVNISWSLPEIEQKVKSLLPMCKNTKPDRVDEGVITHLKSIAGIADNCDTKSLAIVSFLYLYLYITDGFQPLEINVCSSLPTSAGLGSSAAFSVCLAASLLLHSKTIPMNQHIGDNSDGNQWSDEHRKLINDWAFQSEVIIHGKPSGIDNSVSTYGGALVFCNGSIKPLERVPKLRIMLTNTKVPRSTKVLVAGVREKYNKYSAIMSPVLEAMEAVAQTAVKAIEDKVDSDQQLASVFEDLVEMNQHLLRLIGVGHSAIDQVCNVTSRHNLQSKLTGAGGGGCVFTIVPPNTPHTTIVAVQQELSALGFDCWETSVGECGATQHSLSNIKNLKNIPSSSWAELNGSL